MIVSRKELRQIRSRCSEPQVTDQRLSAISQFVAQEKITASVSRSRSKREPLQQQSNRLENCSNIQYAHFDDTQLEFLSHQNQQNRNAQRIQSHGRIKSNTASRKSKNGFKELKSMSLDIDLSGKRLKEFKFEVPQGISRGQIYSLNLSNNEIQEILPKALTPLDSLKELSVNSNLLEKVAFPFNKMRLRKLELRGNKISNLNLEHLKQLEDIDVADNNLIFITVPQSCRVLNVRKNKLSNVYFLEKCERLESVDLSHNLVYDLSFNTYNSLCDNFGSSYRQQQLATKRVFEQNLSDLSDGLPKMKFPSLKKVDCSHNKVCQLNGFKNVGNLSELDLSFNDLGMSKDNLNELFRLNHLQCLGVQENPVQGMYSKETVYSLILKKLTNLKELNSEILGANSTQQQIQIESGQREIKGQLANPQGQNVASSQEFSVEFDSEKKAEGNNNCGFESSSQKPFRLFMDPQIEQKHQEKFTGNQQKISSKIIQQEVKERNFTLGNSDSQERNQKERELEPPSQNDQNPPNKIQPSSRNPISCLKTCLQKQSFNTQGVQSSFEALIQKIFEMSFLPPSPLLSLDESMVSSRRLKENEREFKAFNKLFRAKLGIVYLRKVYIMECHQLSSSTFQPQREKSCDYVFGFLSFEDPQVFQQLIEGTLQFEEVLRGDSKQSIQTNISKVPSAFSCYHVAVRTLRKSSPKLENRRLCPCYYLIESKLI